MSDACARRPLQLVLGTFNRKKGRELAALIEPAGLAALTLADFSGAQEVEETGATFAENARLKAAGYARRLRRWVLADDSGLAVDALDGRPGVFSSRYAGMVADRVASHTAGAVAGDSVGDAANRRRLLEELEGVPPAERGAAFVCRLALADPSGAIRAESEGRCRGRITPEERGERGFGYDPLFEILEYHRTFGQLGETAKNRLSHRARAAAQILPALMRLVDAGEP